MMNLRFSISSLSLLIIYFYLVAIKECLIYLNFYLANLNEWTFTEYSKRIWGIYIHEGKERIDQQDQFPNVKLSIRSW